MENKQQELVDIKKAFDKQSVVFDDIYAKNIRIDYKRQRTRTQLEKYLKPGSRILELNSGTGEDAIYFARKGYKVHATDISDGMLSQLRRKVIDHTLSDSISVEQVSFTNLNAIQPIGSYNAIFSNFGGLNCTDRLDNVLQSFSNLLAPAGIVTLVIMPPFCLWEFMMVIKGNVSLAFRRFFAKKGARAHIEGIYFSCWYYRPSYVINQLKEEFDVLNIEGLCTLVPPSYVENFPQKYPSLYRLLIKLENKFNSQFPFKYIGDYFIITLRKKK